MRRTLRPSYGQPKRTNLQEERRFEDWLRDARPERVAAATIDSVAPLYRLDRRWMEAKLLAAQVKMRREAAALAQPQENR